MKLSSTFCTRTHKRGSALMQTVTFSVVFFLMIAGMAAFVRDINRLTRVKWQVDQAHYVAQSGLSHAFAELESNGFDHAEIAAVEVRQCNDATAMVDLRNIARLRADGSALEVIDAVYVCIKQDGNWRLSIAIGCWPNWKAD